MRNPSFLDFVDSTSGDPGYPSNLAPRVPEMLVNIAHSRKFAIAVNLLGLDFKNDDAAIAKAKQLDRNVSRGADDDRASVGAGAAHDRFQDQKKLLRKHVRCLVCWLRTIDSLTVGQ
jgi:hypothetical protein